MGNFHGGFGNNNGEQFMDVNGTYLHNYDNEKVKEIRQELGDFNYSAFDQKTTQG